MLPLEAQDKALFSSKPSSTSDGKIDAPEAVRKHIKPQDKVGAVDEVLNITDIDPDKQWLTWQIYLFLSVWTIIAALTLWLCWTFMSKFETDEDDNKTEFDHEFLMKLTVYFGAIMICFYFPFKFLYMSKSAVILVFCFLLWGAYTGLAISIRYAPSAPDRESVYFPDTGQCRFVESIEACPYDEMTNFFLYDFNSDDVCSSGQEQAFSGTILNNGYTDTEISDAIDEIIQATVSYWNIYDGTTPSDTCESTLRKNLCHRLLPRCDNECHPTYPCLDTCTETDCDNKVQAFASTLIPGGADWDHYTFTEKFIQNEDLYDTYEGWMQSLAQGCSSGYSGNYGQFDCTAPLAIPDNECAYENGDGYRGKVNTTVTGLACQPWDSDDPHEIFFQDYVYHGLENNYCRQVGVGEPSCYTMSATVPIDVCNITCYVDYSAYDRIYPYAPDSHCSGATFTDNTTGSCSTSYWEAALIQDSAPDPSVSEAEDHPQWQDAEAAVSYLFFGILVVLCCSGLFIIIKRWNFDVGMHWYFRKDMIISVILVSSLVLITSMCFLLLLDAELDETFAVILAVTTGVSTHQTVHSIFDLVILEPHLTITDHHGSVTIVFQWTQNFIARLGRHLGFGWWFEPAVFAVGQFAGLTVQIINLFDTAVRTHSRDVVVYCATIAIGLCLLPILLARGYFLLCGDADALVDSAYIVVVVFLLNDGQEFDVIAGIAFSLPILMQVSYVKMVISKITRAQTYYEAKDLGFKALQETREAVPSALDPKQLARLKARNRAIRQSVINTLATAGPTNPILSRTLTRTASEQRRAKEAMMEDVPVPRFHRTSTFVLQGLPEEAVQGTSQAIAPIDLTGYDIQGDEEFGLQGLADALSPNNLEEMFNQSDSSEEETSEESEEEERRVIPPLPRILSVPLPHSHQKVPPKQVVPQHQPLIRLPTGVRIKLAPLPDLPFSPHPPTGAHSPSHNLRKPLRPLKSPSQRTTQQSSQSLSSPGSVSPTLPPPPPPPPPPMDPIMPRSDSSSSSTSGSTSSSASASTSSSDTPVTIHGAEELRSLAHVSTAPLKSVASVAPTPTSRPRKKSKAHHRKSRSDKDDRFLNQHHRKMAFGEEQAKSNGAFLDRWSKKDYRSHTALTVLAAFAALIGVVLFFFTLVRMVSQDWTCRDRFTSVVWDNIETQVVFENGLLAETGCGIDLVTQLDLSDEELTSIPSSLYDFTNLESLSLRDNQLETISIDLFNRLPYSSFDLANNNIKTLSQSVLEAMEGRQVNLLGNPIYTSIDLSNRELTALPDIFSSPQFQLTNLNLAYNNFTSVPTQVLEMPLQDLDLSYNFFDDLDDTIVDNFPEMRRLSFKGNSLSSLDEHSTEVDLLTNLEFLDLSNTEASDALVSICNLDASVEVRLGNNTNVKQLKWSSEVLSSLSPALGDLNYLTSFVAPRNDLTSLEGLGSLSNLQEMALYQNDLTSEGVFDVIQELSSLDTLSLWDNQVDSIPTSIYSLTSLELLSLSYNPLTENGVESIFASWPHGTIKLESLALRGVGFQNVPPSLINLLRQGSLDKLYIGMNNFSTSELQSIYDSGVEWIHHERMDLFTNFSCDTETHSLNSTFSGNHNSLYGDKSCGKFTFIAPVNHTIRFTINTLQIDYDRRHIKATEGSPVLIVGAHIYDDIDSMDASKSYWPEASIGQTQGYIGDTFTTTGRYLHVLHIHVPFTLGFAVTSEYEMDYEVVGP